MRRRVCSFIYLFLVKLILLWFVYLQATNISMKYFLLYFTKIFLNLFLWYFYEISPNISMIFLWNITYHQYFYEIFLLFLIIFTHLRLFLHINYSFHCCQTNVYRINHFIVVVGVISTCCDISFFMLFYDVNLWRLSHFSCDCNFILAP